MTQMDLHRVFELQYQASRAQVDVPLLVRRERLLRMQKLLDMNEDLDDVQDVYHNAEL